MDAILWEHRADDRSAISEAMSSELRIARKREKDRLAVTMRIIGLHMVSSWAIREIARLREEKPR